MKPIVYVEVSGGVAYVSSSGDVEVVDLDWDNLNDVDEDSEDRRQELLGALAKINPYTHQGNNQETFRQHQRNLIEELSKTPITVFNLSGSKENAL